MVHENFPESQIGLSKRVFRYCEGNEYEVTDQNEYGASLQTKDEDNDVVILLDIDFDADRITIETQDLETGAYRSRREFSDEAGHTLDNVKCYLV